MKQANQKDKKKSKLKRQLNFREVDSQVSAGIICPDLPDAPGKEHSDPLLLFEVRRHRHWYAALVWLSVWMACIHYCHYTSCLHIVSPKRAEPRRPSKKMWCYRSSRGTRAEAERNSGESDIVEVQELKQSGIVVKATWPSRNVG